MTKFNQNTSRLGEDIMIYVTGDTHCDWLKRLSKKAFPEQKQMTKDDYVIICGDFGIWDNSKAENYNLDLLEQKPFTTLFISGNHDNYDILDNLPVEEWHGGDVNFIRPSVIHLRRGQIFDIDGKTFFTFGGASSHDISGGILEPDDPLFKIKKKELDKTSVMYRINHVSWWNRELPSDEEMQIGINNLDKYGGKVDYIITHSPYTAIINAIDENNLYPRDYLMNYLQFIRENARYTHWFFGHIHESGTFVDEKATCLYEYMYNLTEREKEWENSEDYEEEYIFH